MNLKTLSKNKKTIKFSLAILFLLSIIGLVLIGNIIHENIHRLDFKDINKFDEDICYLKLGDDISAHYRFTFTDEESYEVERIRKYAEFRAYGVNIFLIVIYVFCFFMSLNWIKEKFEK